MPTGRSYLEEIILSNYRGFQKITIPFHDKLTVFVAHNGGGKTAVLDAIAISLRLFVDTVDGKSTSKGFEAEDIRLVMSPSKSMEPVTPVEFVAKAYIAGREIVWSRERTSTKDSKTTTAEAQPLKTIASDLRRQNIEWLEGQRKEPPVFPLIAFYGTGRLWNEGRFTERKKAPSEPSVNSRLLGYTDCLSSASHYKIFADWFKRFSYEAIAEDAGKEKSPHDPKKLLDVVRQAVDIALEPSGWHNLDWDFVEETIIAKHATHGILPVYLLSDGIRTMVGLVADIAHRAARLNPHLESNAAKESPGIVLIDEVDMHLHPAWQQVVLEALVKAFPNIQFIVTSHSPQVLTTVQQDSILVLQENKVLKAPYGTDGAEAQRILQDLFGVSSRPNTPIAQLLTKYMNLVNEGQGKTSEALKIREKLDDWSKGQEPSLVEADMIIENLEWESKK